MRKWIPLIIVLLALVLPLLIESHYFMHIIVLSLIYAILATSLGLVVGGIRVVSLSHVAFFGVGAYTSAILTVRYDVPFLVALLCSFLMSAFIGFLFSVPILKLKGHYLAMGTLAFGIVAQMVFLNWENLTNGPNGIAGIPYPSIFGFMLDSETKIYYFVLVSLIVLLMGLYSLNRSVIGRALITIREDEIVASSFGIRTVHYKVAAFTISTGIAGYAGSIFAHYSAYINYDNFNLMESFILLAMVVIGGMNHILGPVVGAILLTVLPEALRELVDYRMLIYGLILIGILPFAPRGLLGSLPTKWIKGKIGGGEH
ncbi:branched-chain amino acid ABC transporter permease [Bacillus niameyensis]|uniref:branched-chain amino acid ABC transporter permease n=1 Tax=Bacillus niameyensis TaxID=1522308 RepID=UPI000783C444|nr:branched-chain amino acid ABC transporter permease [Bacillus niameyensis]